MSITLGNISTTNILKIIPDTKELLRIYKEIIKTNKISHTHHVVNIQQINTDNKDKLFDKFVEFEIFIRHFYEKKINELLLQEIPKVEKSFTILIVPDLLQDLRFNKKEDYIYKLTYRCLSILNNINTLSKYLDYFNSIDINELESYINDTNRTIFYINERIKNVGFYDAIDGFVLKARLTKIKKEHDILKKIFDNFKEHKNKFFKELLPLILNACMICYIEYINTLEKELKKIIKELNKQDVNSITYTNDYNIKSDFINKILIKYKIIDEILKINKNLIDNTLINLADKIKKDLLILLGINVEIGYKEIDRLTDYSADINNKMFEIERKLISSSLASPSQQRRSISSVSPRQQTRSVSFFREPIEETSHKQTRSSLSASQLSKVKLSPKTFVAQIKENREKEAREVAEREAAEREAERREAAERREEARLEKARIEEEEREAARLEEEEREAAARIEEEEREAAARLEKEEREAAARLEKARLEEEKRKNIKDELKKEEKKLQQIISDELKPPVSKTTIFRITKEDMIKKAQDRINMLNLQLGSLSARSSPASARSSPASAHSSPASAASVT